METCSPCNLGLVFNNGFCFGAQAANKVDEVSCVKRLRKCQNLFFLAQAQVKSVFILLNSKLLMLTY